MYTNNLYNFPKISYKPVFNGIADQQLKADQSVLFGYIIDVQGVNIIDSTIYDQNILPYNYASFAGTCYEKNEEKRYNVDVRVYDKSNNLISTLVTNNGEFKFINLNKDIFYNIEFQDNSNKYLGKKIYSIKPETDIIQPCAIVLMDYKKDITVGSTYKAIFKTYGIGSKGVSSTNKPAWLTIDQINSDFYSIYGTIPSGTTNVNYTIRLSDSRTNGEYTSDVIISHKVN